MFGCQQRGDACGFSRSASSWRGADDTDFVRLVAGGFSARPSRQCCSDLDGDRRSCCCARTRDRRCAGDGQLALDFHRQCSDRSVSFVDRLAKTTGYSRPPGAASRPMGCRACDGRDQRVDICDRQRKRLGVGFARYCLQFCRRNRVVRIIYLALRAFGQSIHRPVTFQDTPFHGCDIDYGTLFGCLWCNAAFNRPVGANSMGMVRVENRTSDRPWPHPRADHVASFRRKTYSAIWPGRRRYRRDCAIRVGTDVVGQRTPDWSRTPRWSSPACCRLELELD